MKLSEFLIKERLKRNLTQKQLAIELNITQTSLCHFERGNRIPSYINIDKIAKYFDITTAKVREML